MNFKSLTFVASALVVIVVLMSWASSFSQKSENPEPTTRKSQISTIECDMGVKAACR